MAKIVTITNPLTGQPAQVDQLDHTAQQIDDGLNIARGVSNPNLLDNWYFGNPVDQRQGRVVKPNTTYYSDNKLTTAAGTTSAYVTAYRYATGTASGVNYASFKLEDKDTAPTYYAAPENVVRGYTGAGYTVDRNIMLADGTVLITNDGLKLTGKASGNVQVLDKTVQRDIIVTFSVFYKGTVTLTHYGAPYLNSVHTSSDWNVASYTYTIPAGTDLRNRLYCPIFGNGTAAESEQTTGDTYVLASKFELGTQQTLAHQDANGNWVLNELPNYGEQLRRCQRYYYDSRFGRVNESDGAYSATLTTSNAYLAGNYRFPVTMRVKPGIKIYSYHGTANRVSYWISGADVDKPVEVNNLTVGTSGFNAIQAATAFEPNTYAFHIVANAEL